MNPVQVRGRSSESESCASLALLATRLTARMMRSGAVAGMALLLLGVAGCGGVKLIAHANIPTPLVTKIPVAVAVHMPKEFSSYVHKEERWSTDWSIELGQAQSAALTSLLNAMFERVVAVESVNGGAQLGGDIRAILEPSVEEYAFVTPRDAGSPFYAVSIKYRVNVYAPDGRLADSWGFTGYGTSPAQGLSSSAPLMEATALAMRDAGAKLAVEFRDQAVVRGLLPETPPATQVTPDAPQEKDQANETPGDAGATSEPSPAAPPEVPSPAEPASDKPVPTT